MLKRSKEEIKKRGVTEVEIKDRRGGEGGREERKGYKKRSAEGGVGKRKEGRKGRCERNREGKEEEGGRGRGSNSRRGVGAKYSTGRIICPRGMISSNSEEEEKEKVKEKRKKEREKKKETYRKEGSRRGKRRYIPNSEGFRVIVGNKELIESRYRKNKVMIE